MSALNNWRMQTGKPARPKLWGPRPQSFITAARTSMGGRIVVDLPASIRLALCLKPGVRIWFAPRGDGIVITGNERSTKHSQVRRRCKHHATVMDAFEKRKSRGHRMQKIKIDQAHKSALQRTRPQSRVTTTVSAAALCCVLAACGGGGGGNASTTASAGSNQPGGNNTQATSFSAMHWAVGPSLQASGAIATYMPSMANIAPSKVMVVYAQSETGGNKLYSSVGDLTAGTWTAPTPINGYAGTVQGVNALGGGAFIPPATVVSANPVTGVATVAWTSQVTGEATLRVWLSSYSNSTSVWSTPAQIGTAAVSGLKITRSDAGDTLIGWLSASSVNPGTQALNTYTVSAAGATTTDLLELGSSPFAALKLGLSDANTVVAVWAGSAQSVMLARKTGSTWAAPVSLGTGAPASESDLDLVVNADGSDAVAWGGVDPSIHTVLHDNAGTLITSQLVAHGSVGNVRPALASLGAGKYALVFAASSLGGVGVANYEPYSSSFTPGAGWSTPLALFPNGASGAGNQQLRADAAGDALAINMGLNLNGYSLASESSAWAVATNIVFGGAVPAFVQEGSTGRGVIVWCNNSQLQSAFFK